MNATPANSQAKKPLQKRIKIMLLRSLVFVAAILLALAVSRLVAQQFVARKMAIPSNQGIQSLEQISLGGVKQWISIRGWDRSKPLLIFLHGGPGFPQMPFDRLNGDLEKYFVVIQWDQRGAGKSYSAAIPAEAMTVANFVSDSHELTQLMLKRFSAKKCYLVAHSWGSLFGALLVSQYPDLFYAYISIGQVAAVPEMQQVRYQYALDAATREKNKKALADLRKIGRPPHSSFADCKIMEHWVRHYSRSAHTPFPATKMVWLAFGFPGYSWIDLARIPRGLKFSFAHLWKEIFYQTDLFQQAWQIDVPVYFLSGRYDEVATPQVIQQYFDRVRAPRGKELIWFANSGHWPQFEEAQKYREILVNKILPETSVNVPDTAR